MNPVGALLWEPPGPSMAKNQLDFPKCTPHPHGMIRDVAKAHTEHVKLDGISRRAIWAVLGSTTYLLYATLPINCPWGLIFAAVVTTAIGLAYRGTCSVGIGGPWQSLAYFVFGPLCDANPEASIMLPTFCTRAALARFTYNLLTCQQEGDC